MAFCPQALQGHWLSPAGITTPHLAWSLTSRPQTPISTWSTFVRTNKTASVDGWCRDR